jgi:hypothetical protein
MALIGFTVEFNPATQRPNAAASVRQLLADRALVPRSRLFSIRACGSSRTE